MKILVIVLSLFLVGCVSAPVNPLHQISRDVLAGRCTLTADEINKACDDHRAAYAEWEQSASCKAVMLAVSPLLILGGAANGLPFGPASHGHGYGYRGSGKVVINSTPTAGGGYRTTIDPMY